MTETSINLKVSSTLLGKELTITMIISLWARKVSSKIEVEFLCIFIFLKESVGVTPHRSASDY